MLAAALVDGEKAAELCSVLHGDAVIITELLHGKAQYFLTVRVVAYLLDQLGKATLVGSFSHR